FNDTATTEIYTLSLHDALPISIPTARPKTRSSCRVLYMSTSPSRQRRSRRDRKSTRLNSSHLRISYAVFCLKNEVHTFELPAPSIQELLLLLYNANATAT